MTLLSSSPSESKPKQTKKKKAQDLNGGQSKPKRTKSPGVRVHNGRIYDSDNGKTCHQCRQKTMDFMVWCKNQTRSRPCTIHLCHKCLLNRYGEIAEEVDLVENWMCPKCRGICNCSFCMKKKGHKPTGTLIRAAKATGFSSASELIQEKGIENLDIYKAAVAPPKKLVSPKKLMSMNRESKVYSLSKTSSLDSCKDETLTTSESTTVSNAKKRKKVKKEGLEDVCSSHNKRPKFSKVSEKEMRKKGKDGGAFSGRKKSKITDSPSSMKLDDVEKKSVYVHNQDVAVNNSDSDDNVEAKINGSVKPQGFKKIVTNIKNEEIEFDLSLPKANILRTALGIDLSPEDVGNALQFLEFCASFGKACKFPTRSKEKIDDVATPCNEKTIIACLENSTPTH